MGKAKVVHKVRGRVTNKNGRTILIKGNAKHVLQLPGGTVKKGETRKQAIKREMEEELGRKVTKATKVTTKKFKRNGTVEVTTVFDVEVSGRTHKKARKLTGREKRRGLRPVKYDSATDATAALQGRVQKFSRSAAKRDLKLIRWS